MNNLHGGGGGAGGAGGPGGGAPMGPHGTGVSNQTLLQVDNPYLLHMISSIVKRLLQIAYDR